MVKNKKYSITAAFIFLFLVSIVMILFPVIVKCFNSISRACIISQFKKDIIKINERDYCKIIESARTYNQSLLPKRYDPYRFCLTESGLEEYRNILDVTGTGIIGAIEIAAINVKIPVYLGTDKSILKLGMGHLEGSSLPIGGSDTHSVLCGHRETLLAKADRLILGDVFTLKILNETLTYMIDSIVVVKPENFDYLTIEPGKDYCTLITCTPFGTTYNRLLLRGVRVFP